MWNDPETWASNNAKLLTHLASRGVVVVTPTRVGELSGAGADAPIAGGLLPGAQFGRDAFVRTLFPRYQRFLLHAL